MCAISLDARAASLDDIAEDILPASSTVAVLLAVGRLQDVLLQGFLNTTTGLGSHARIRANVGGIGISKDAVVERVPQVIYLTLVDEKGGERMGVSHT